MNAISEFRENYFFLSNFYPCKVTYACMEFQSVEAAFQAAKCANPNDRAQFRNLGPGAAKRLGKRISPRPDWEAEKVNIMRNLLWRKFLENPDLLTNLLKTGDAQLTESNRWHDNYWGDCTCSKCAGVHGQNHLGQLLMEIRANFRGDRHV